jgi:2-keto-3-deoxy-L-fuconate dehydrogenase
MTQLLAGKTALITGAAAGIGRATSELFLSEGAKVIATDRDVSALAGFGGTVRKLDVTDDAAIRSLAAEVGALDILFNCAGIVPGGTILEADDAQWEQAMAVNVYSIAKMTRAFLPAMIVGGGGAIINVASVAGSIKGIVNRCTYGASKAAVIGLTKSVAADFVTKNIRCNAVCPGTVDSPSLQQRLKDTGDYDAARKAFVARQPMGRLGKAEEIAGLVLYLSSEAGAFTTGQAFAVDGGITI